MEAKQTLGERLARAAHYRRGRRGGDRSYIAPSRNRAAIAIFWPVGRVSRTTSIMGKTKMAISMRKCVVMVPKKNWPLLILHTLSVIVWSQMDWTGTQRKMSIKVRRKIHMTTMTSITRMGMRIDEILNRRQYKDKMAILEQAIDEA
jgi:hypothetical protein